MQFLVVFTPKPGPQPADFMQREVEEQAQARVLYKEGGLRQAWALATKERGAACLFEAADADDLQRMIDSFPLVRLAYCDYAIHPLAPYPGFVKKMAPQTSGG